MRRSCRWAASRSARCGSYPEHPQQAQRFLEYLLSPEVIERYVQEQAAISPLRESSAGDPALGDVLGYFDDGRSGSTFLVAVTATVLVNVIALDIALGLNARIRLRSTLRGVFFVPNLLSVLIIGHVFNYLFANSLPALGQALGIDVLSSSILANESLAWVGIVTLAVWQAAAFNIIIYIAGLETIDPASTRRTR